MIRQLPAGSCSAWLCSLWRQTLAAFWCRWQRCQGSSECWWSAFYFRYGIWYEKREKEMKCFKHVCDLIWFINIQKGILKNSFFLFDYHCIFVVGLLFFGGMHDPTFRRIWITVAKMHSREKLNQQLWGKCNTFIIFPWLLVRPGSKLREWTFRFTNKGDKPKPFCKCFWTHKHFFLLWIRDTRLKTR